MTMFSSSWFWMMIVAVFFAMHMFGHDGHGWHEGHLDSRVESRPAGTGVAPAPAQPTKEGTEATGNAKATK